MTDPGLTARFAAALHDWLAEEPEVTEACRRLLIDGIAVAVAGAGEPGPSLMADAARGEGSRPVSSVIGHGFATSPAAAARVNGIAMHVLDFEPMWNPPNHALSPTLPAILALAEVREGEGAPPQGAGVLRALAKGVEAQGRLRRASNQLEPKELTLHPPGVVGPIASAVACTDLLGLDHGRLVAAIGIACSRAAGLLANVGSMTKALHCGDAAASGLGAALLAARGFTADLDPLAGPRGYAQAYFGAGFDPSWLVAPVKTPRVLDPGPAWKLFPSQYATHFVITAALDARARIADPRAIRSIAITTPVMAYIDRPSPKSGLDGKFSLQYCVAAALLDGRVDVASFTDTRLRAPDAQALLQRTTLRQLPEISGRFDEMHVDVAVDLADGTTVSERCSAPLGSWSRPVPPERLEEKWRGILNREALGDAADEVWDRLHEKPERIGVRALMQLLGREPAD